MEKYCRLSCHNEWDESNPIPVISSDTIVTLLAVMHGFTTLGLEAQGTACACGSDGVIKYLAILPQINKKDTVYDDPSMPSDLSMLDAYEFFQAHYPSSTGEDYCARCWIHIHSRHQAYMSHINIYQMFMLEKGNYSFSLVISPRYDGLKMLAVRLTEAGRREIQAYTDEVVARNKEIEGRNKERKERGEPDEALEKLENAANYVQGRIDASSTKFYYQVPLSLSDDPCVVVDFRDKEQVVKRLKTCVARKEYDYHWLQRHSF